jgi:hypothetical protein
MGQLVAKVAILVSLMAGGVDGPTEGVGAYYTKPGLFGEVCERRVANGWHPVGVELDCSFPCLAAGIEQDTLGGYVLAWIPGASFHV